MVVYARLNDSGLSGQAERRVAAKLLTQYPFLRLLKRQDPEEYDRIAALRDGIRSARTSATRGNYVFCQAGRYQQLFLLDE